jgi:signal transduction histidine kinase/CheY-like chemotaxis protein/ligand-binding sensor domain-containing protein
MNVVSKRCLEYKRISILVSLALLVFGVLLGIPGVLFCQTDGIKYFRNYSKRDYGLKPQNFAVLQDKRGVIYVGNNGGLLEFDGVSWRYIGIPNHTVRSLAGNEAGTIYIGGKGEFGYLAADKQDTLKYQSLLGYLKDDQKDFSDVWKTYATEEGIYFQTSKYLFRWDWNARTMKKIWKSDSNHRFKFSFVCGGRLFVRRDKIGLTQMVKDSLEPVPGGEIFATKKIYMMVLYDTDRILIGTRSNGFYIYDGKTMTPFTTEADDYLIEKRLYHGIRLSFSSTGSVEFAMATLRGGLVIMDSSGRIKYIFNKAVGLADDNVKYVFEDGQGNLWLALDNGISQVEYSSPISIYSENGLSLPGNVLSITRHGVRRDLYAGTTHGLYFFPMSAYASQRKFRPVPGILTNCWSLLSIDDSLLAATTSGIFQVNKDNTTHRKIIGNRCYTLIPSQKDINRIWTGTRDGLFSLYLDPEREKENKKQERQWVKEHKFEEINQEIRTIVEDKNGGLWLGTLTKGILKVDFPGDIFQPVLTPYHTAHGLPGGEVNVFTAAGHVIFATTGKGIYRFNKKSGRFIPDSILGSEFIGGPRGIFRIIEDKQKNIWVHSESRNFQAVLGANGTFEINSTPFLRIPIAQVNAIYPDPDGEIIWFAGDDGLIRYDTTVKKNYDHNYQTLIRKVTTIDEKLLVFNGYTTENKVERVFPVFAYKDRNIRFSFAAPFFEKKDSTTYRYLLEGYDKSWSAWVKDTKVDYTNLDSGTYTFRVQASNVYGKLGREDSFRLKVLPPWYKTWWAFVIYSFLFFGMMFLVVKWRSGKLEHDKQRLEQVVKERTKEVYQKNELLEEQSQKLKEMDRVKSRFFANISHEFRTPLTLIMGPVEQMLAKKRGHQEEKQLGLMLRNSHRLLHLINQLLDLSRFDSGKMKLQAVCQDIVSFVRGIAASFEVLSQQERLDLLFKAEKEEISLYFDPGKMEEAITNLLINAIKFTPARGKITVSITREQPEEDNGVQYLKISVKDTGVGMPKEQLVHIFDRFYQASSSRENDRKGTGIGLSLTKEIVTLHHGQIDAHSTKGEGTEFAIRLPMGKDHLKADEIADPSRVSLHPGKHAEAAVDYLKPEEEQENSGIESAGTNDGIEPGKEHQPGEQEKHVILVVEDHADVRKYIRAPLEPRYTVVEAKDGKEGIDKAREIIPDLIISDIMMPELDGYELCKVLKTDIITSHIPVILLTARASEESMVQGLETGADDYITKPFSTKILTVRIKNLIELRRQLQMKIQRQKMLLPAEINVSSLDETFLKELHDVVEKNLGDPDFNIDRLCEKLYMGRTSLFKKVQALTGETPNQFIQSYRLQRAAQLLKANFGNVTEVAFEVGFSNSAYFTKCFKEKFHQLPSTFLAAEGSSSGQGLF